jgi:hypothetical protein
MIATNWTRSLRENKHRKVTVHYLDSQRGKGIEIIDHEAGEKIRLYGDDTDLVRTAFACLMACKIKTIETIFEAEDVMSVLKRMEKFEE